MRAVIAVLHLNVFFLFTVFVKMGFMNRSATIHGVGAHLDEFWPEARREVG